MYTKQQVASAVALLKMMGVTAADRGPKLSKLADYAAMVAGLTGDRAADFAKDVERPIILGQ